VQQEKWTAANIDSLPSRSVLFYCRREFALFILVAVESIDGRDGAKEAVLLTVIPAVKNNVLASPAFASLRR